MKTVIRFLISITCLGITSSLAQNIDSLMKKYVDLAPVEKIYIQFDRPSYDIGETIFYKVYLLRNGKWNAESKNIYINWFDDNGNCIKQTVAPILLSSSQGSFNVPKNYTGNALRMVAYTGWMLNDHQRDYLFERVFTFPKNKRTDKTNNIQKTKVELFPEGGDLVFNLASRVAFKSTDNNGMPVAITGKVVNGRGEEIATLKTEHDGMGLFSCKPVSGENYFINWKDIHGNEGTQQFTNIKDRGGVLTVYQTNENAQITVQVNHNSTGIQPYKLLIHQDQVLLAQKELYVANASAMRITFPLFNCSTGIIQFTLLTSDNKPVAERIIYVDNEDYSFETNISMIEKNLTKRGKNIADISLQDTLLANLSISVYDPQTSGKEVHSIISGFLLSNELRGYIHNPAYYVDAENPKRNEHIDLLMLTHGWRRFDWQAITTGVFPKLKFSMRDDFVGVKGRFIESSNLLSDTSLLNMVVVQSDSTAQYLTTVTVGNNPFEIKNLIITDTAKIYYGFQKKKEKTIKRKILFENGLHLGDAIANYTFHDPDPVWQQQPISNTSINTFDKEVNELKEVIVGTKAKSKIELLDERYTTGVFRGGNARTFDLISNGSPAYADVFNYLQGRVPGFYIGFGVKDSNEVIPKPRPVITNIRTSYSPILFLDQSPIDDVNSLIGININDIAYIKVFDPGFVGGGLSSPGGAIALYSKRGTEVINGTYIPPGMDVVTLTGYNRFKEFYSPMYSRDFNPAQPDNRKTIYWNPSIILSKEKNTQRIEFYNNDLSTKLIMVLEGINVNGKISRVVKQID
jgi:hypothetical protein